VLRDITRVNPLTELSHEIPYTDEGIAVRVRVRVRVKVRVRVIIKSPIRMRECFAL